MINFNNVYFKYPKFVVNNLSFDISDGEIISIVGGNASGKTTLINLLSGFLKCKNGEILINGVSIKDSDKTIGSVYQNPETQIIFDNVYDDMCFTLKSMKVDKSEFDKRIDEALELVNMKDFKNSSTSQMSMGQKQRIVIANMLAKRPKIMIFDEASAYLDQENKRMLYNLFDKLKSQGITVIFSTNMIEEIVYSDKTMILSNGELVKFDKTSEVLKDLTVFEKLNFNLPLKLILINKYDLKSKFDEDIAKEIELKIKGK